jgi:hypothetical protein
VRVPHSNPCSLGLAGAGVSKYQLIAGKESRSRQAECIGMQYGENVKEWKRKMAEERYAIGSYFELGLCFFWERMEARKGPEGTGTGANAKLSGHVSTLHSVAKSGDNGMIWLRHGCDML